jgi:DNA-binding NarL/FixJ family response regulator
MIRVLLVDDQPLFRDGLRAVLGADPELQVVGEAADGEAALRLVETERPDVVLMDLRMPGMGGVTATRRMRVQRPQCQVLVLTTFDDDRSVFEALRAGAIGYLLKDATAAQLRDAVRAAAAGRSVLNPAVAAKVLAELARLRASPETRQPGPFTAREAEVLALLARGATNKEIAAALFVSEGTVKNHVTQIFAKLEVTDRTQAALRARELGYC